MRSRWWLAVIPALALAALGGIATLGQAPEQTRDVVGKLSLRSGVYVVAGTSVCWGEDGYDDIEEGTRVTLTDADGTVVGLSALRAGTLNSATDACEFLWRADDVPLGRRFYGVRVANRGVVRLAEQELSGTIRLTLG